MVRRRRSSLRPDQSFRLFGRTPVTVTKPTEKLRLNPRRAWYRNLDEVVPNGDYEVTFKLKQPQPAFIALLASGFTPVYPCHVSPAQMRQHPSGTGPFKFVEFKPNEYIKVARNPDYWKKDRPYLDGIEYQIIKNVATGSLAFVSGKVDMTSWYFLQVPMLKDINNQMGQELCHMAPLNVLRSVIINREARWRRRSRLWPVWVMSPHRPQNAGPIGKTHGARRSVVHWHAAR